MTRDVEKIVERQIAKWRTYQQQRVEEPAPDKPAADAVAVSYSLASRGCSIADQIAERLGMSHFDHEIVEHIATSARVHTETVESLDKHVQSRIDEWIAALFRERNFDRSDYLRLLGRTVVALWEHGPCVLSGHGAVHLVPREHALAVRLTAPVEVRGERLASKRGLELSQARRELQRADSEQAAFHRRFFGVDVDDTDQYDLIVDTSRLAPDEVAALVSEAYRLRFSRGEEPLAISA